jgi:hypothetical protein
MKRLRTLKSYQIFKTGKKPIAVNILFKAYPMVSLSCRSNLVGRYLQIDNSLCYKAGSPSTRARIGRQNPTNILIFGLTRYYVPGSGSATLYGMLQYSTFWQDPTLGATVLSLLVFFSYAIVLNTVVPISLYVSVEVLLIIWSFKGIVSRGENHNWYF